MKKLERNIYLGVIMVLLLLGVRQCRKLNQADKAYIDDVNTVLGITEQYKNKLGTITARANTLQLRNAALKATLMQKDDTLRRLAKSFSKVRHVAQFTTTAKMPEAGIKFETPLPSPCDSLVVVERSGAFREKWFGFTYHLTQDSLKIANLTLHNTTTVITGLKRNGLFTRPVAVTEVTHSNPYITTDNITAAEVVLPTPWHKKWYVWLAAGVLGGALIR